MRDYFRSAGLTPMFGLTLIPRVVGFTDTVLHPMFSEPTLARIVGGPQPHLKHHDVPSERLIRTGDGQIFGHPVTLAKVEAAIKARAA